jgi:hypothetical protein
VNSLREQLKKIEKETKDGNFVDAEGNILAGQDRVKSLMYRCWRWTEIVLERCVGDVIRMKGQLLTRNREGKIDERFREQYERLLEIRNQLDRLSVTQAWSLRETDLFGYQRKLDRIDEARVNGNFVDAEGQPADLHAQRVGKHMLQLSFVSTWLTDIRHCCTSFVAAMHTFMRFSFHQSPYLKLFFQSTTNFRLFVGA